PAGFLYRFGDAPTRFATTLGPHAFPIKTMVEMLGSVIEDRALTCFLDDFFETPVLEFAPLYQIVEIGDVGGVMLPVMELQGFLRNVWRQRVEGIGQIRQFKGHRGYRPF